MHWPFVVGIVNFRKDKQEAGGIRADNRQKEMDLSKMYVDELTFGLPPSHLGHSSELDGTRLGVGLT